MTEMMHNTQGLTNAALHSEPVVFLETLWLMSRWMASDVVVKKMEERKGTDLLKKVAVVVVFFLFLFPFLSLLFLFLFLCFFLLLSFSSLILLTFSSSTTILSS
jgi:hypothetical protein